LEVLAVINWNWNCN